MAVSIDDVWHIASLARIGLTTERARSLVTELNGILAHMEVLQQTDVSGVSPAEEGSAPRLPLRADEGPKYPLARPLETIAPLMRDGFFLVPRLATHEDVTDAVDAAE